MSKDFKVVWSKTKDLLSRRAYSEPELKKKLLLHFNSDLVQQALVRANKNKWLESPQARAYNVALAGHHKKKGHFYIQSVLKKKGLPPVPKQDEVEKALWWINKKFNSKTPLDKIYRFLSFRGFAREDITKALHKIRENRSVTETL